MENVIKTIYKWQVDAGNAEEPYDDHLEASFQVEEALEGFDMFDLSKLVNAPIANPKEVARSIVKIALDNSQSVMFTEYTPITDVDRLDKACDAIVYAIGSMAKLGLNPHQITEALTIVNNANKQKLNCPRDELGKLMKPDNFVEPQVKLQELLNKVNKSK